MLPENKLPEEEWVVRKVLPKTVAQTGPAHVAEKKDAVQEPEPEAEMAVEAEPAHEAEDVPAEMEMEEEKPKEAEAEAEAEEDANEEEEEVSEFATMSHKELQAECKKRGMPYYP